MSRHALVWLLGAALLATAPAGCIGTRKSHPSSYYMLSSLASVDPSLAATLSPEGLAVGVGPVSLPPHLNRPQIVTSATLHRFQLAEFHKWAEPLQDNVAHTISANLAVLLKTDQIDTFPWPRSFEPDFQIRFFLASFSADAEGRVQLVARWVVLDPAGTELFASVSTLSEQATPGDYDSIVAAMSRAIESLSREVAAHLQQQPR